MIVLHWLHKAPTSAKMYVANRVAETEELTNGGTWRHVPTTDNPADLASRGLSAPEIISNDLWWQGLAWLKSNASRWPDKLITLTTEEMHKVSEENNPPVVMTITEQIPLMANADGDLLQQHSNLHRLVRVTAWAMRFIKNAKQRPSKLPQPLQEDDRTNAEREPISPLESEELIDAENKWISAMQKHHFANEIESCRNNIDRDAKLLKKSKLLGLKPILPADDILRISGRMDNADLPYDVRRPIILSNEYRLTKLIIEAAHKATLHGGTQLTMQYSRQKYWIIKMRTTIRNVIHKCIKCVRQKAITMQQQMGTLPSSRVTAGRPFEETGVDYCGPFTIKARSGRCKTILKGYAAIFVCMKSKATHIELVQRSISGGSQTCCQPSREGPSTP